MQYNANSALFQAMQVLPCVASGEPTMVPAHSNLPISLRDWKGQFATSLTQFVCLYPQIALFAHLD